MVVKSNGSIVPIPAYSWTSGFEIAPNKNTGWYLYYSGNYGDRESVLDTTVTPNRLVGWGFAGGSNGADRYIQEAIAGYSRVAWKGENLGSVQMGFQYGYVWLSPWTSAGGPGQTHSNMVFGQTRYNLPEGRAWAKTGVCFLGKRMAAATKMQASRMDRFQVVKKMRERRPKLSGPQRSSLFRHHGFDLS